MRTFSENGSHEDQIYTLDNEVFWVEEGLRMKEGQEPDTWIDPFQLDLSRMTVEIDAGKLLRIRWEDLKRPLLAFIDREGLWTIIDGWHRLAYALSNFEPGQGVILPVWLLDLDQVSLIKISFTELTRALMKWTGSAAAVGEIIGEMFKANSTQEGGLIWPVR